MVLLGTLINAICIIAETLIGMIFLNFQKGAKETVMYKIGLNIIGLTKVRVANLLPAILVVAAFVSVTYYLGI